MRIPARLKHAEGAILQIDLPPIARNLVLAGRIFEAKREFHVTLVGREILRQSGFIDLPAVEAAVANASRGLRFSVELRDEFRLVREDDARTVVRMCDVEGAEDFYLRLEHEMGGSLVRPPHHVTLYMSATRKGIGIASQDDLARLSRALESDELEDLLRAIT